MDHVEELNSAPGFVSLQMPNQVPARSFAAQFDYLSFRFLNPIFAEICEARGQSGFQRFHRMRFANRNQSYLISRAIGPLSGGFDPQPNVRKSVTDFVRLVWFSFHESRNQIETKE
jgi:hypothetical protein